MPDIAMVKQPNKLVPANEMASEDLALIPNGTELLVNPKQPHNAAQFNLAWALAQKLAEACDWLADKDDAMHMLKLKAKHVSVIMEPNGTVELRPKSIAWDKLGQAAFSRVFNRMIYIVCSEIIPGLKESDLRREIEKMAGAEIPKAASGKQPSPPRKSGSGRGAALDLASRAAPSENSAARSNPPAETSSEVSQ